MLSAGGRVKEWERGVPPDARLRMRELGRKMAGTDRAGRVEVMNIAKSGRFKVAGCDTDVMDGQHTVLHMPLVTLSVQSGSPGQPRSTANVSIT